MANSLAMAGARESCHAIRYATSFHTDVLCFCNTSSIMQQNSPQKKTFIITSKLLSYTTKTMSVINPPFISNFVPNIIHRRHNHLGQLSRKTKGRHGQEKKDNLCQFTSCHCCCLCPTKNVGALPFLFAPSNNCCLFHSCARV